MNVMTYEDIQEHCAVAPCTKEEFINMLKRCVFRCVNRHASYMVYFRSVNGPIARPHTLNELYVLLAQINVALLTQTNAMKITTWKVVPFEQYQ
jgi:hypothetical protein